jgi:branched-chain amino acid transport system permease protein
MMKSNYQAIEHYSRIIESLAAGYIGDLTGGFLGSHYQDIFAFLVLITVLIFRPSGLLGERVADRA